MRAVPVALLKAGGDVQAARINRITDLDVTIKAEIKYFVRVVGYLSLPKRA